MSTFDVIALDADDTLWHNERLYADAQARFKDLLAQYQKPEWIEQRLFQTEVRNLEHFGYGIKAFALSMIETAIDLTEGRISGSHIQVIINIAREMLAADVELLEHTLETIEKLATTHELMLITKGELRDQEIKVNRSGLASYFKMIEIMSDKSRQSYTALLNRHGIAPEHFLMVGNSLRSDILPVLEIGGTAVYIPYPLTWEHEIVEPPPASQPRFYEIEHLGQLPDLLEKVDHV